MRAIAASLLMSSTLLAADAHAPADKSAGTHASHAPTVTPTDTRAAPTPQDALKMLMDGNKRFAAGESAHPNAGQDRRCLTTSGGQHPFATILSCADSRVPPEMLFDAGIGDLFVIRVAGNVSDTDEIATIEYGAGHLNTPLIVVMGHTKCGAVTAVVQNAPLHGNLAKLVDNIQPAAVSVKHNHPELAGNSLVAKTIRQNVYQSIEDLITNSPDVQSLLKDKKVMLVGAIYDIHSGEVEFVGTHPNEAALLTAPAKPSDSGHAAPHAAAPTGHDSPHAAPADPHKPAASHDGHGESHGTKDAHDPHGNGHGAADAHGSDAHAEVKPEESPLKKYGPIGAFSIGSLALSAVVLHLIRR
jgi:carbonic anhydrase